jgi:hypothetical protein
VENCEPGLQEDGKLCFRSDFPSASKSSKAFSLLGFSGSTAAEEVPAKMHKQICFCSSPNVSHTEYECTILIPTVYLQLHLNKKPLNQKSMNNKSRKSNINAFFPHIPSPCQCSTNDFLNIQLYKITAQTYAKKKKQKQKWNLCSRCRNFNGHS